MAAPVYATSAEYDASPYGRAAAPADIDDRLAIASADIDYLLTSAVYDVDANQQPTDTDIAEAMREATIAQASYGIDPSLSNGESMPAGYTSVSIGSASLTRGKAAPEIRIGGVLYAPRALMILHQAGLTPGEAWIW